MLWVCCTTSSYQQYPYRHSHDADSAPAIRGYNSPLGGSTAYMHEWRCCWLAEGMGHACKTHQNSVLHSQAAFSENPPAVYSPESGLDTPAITPQQSPAVAPQQALQPAVSQVHSCRDNDMHCTPDTHF